MKSKTVVSVVMIMSLAASSLAFAQGRGERDDRGRNERAQENRHQDRRHDDGRQADRRDDRGRGYAERGDERGAGPNHQFHRGERLPAEYHNRYYVVDDWRGHQLSAPPRGYHWVQTGSDYVLVAITTGIILNLLLSH